MNRIIQYFRQHQQKTLNKKSGMIQERIAELNARIGFWEGKRTENGTLPKHICRFIDGWKAEKARMKIRLISIQTPETPVSFRRPVVP